MKTRDSIKAIEADGSWNPGNACDAGTHPQDLRHRVDGVPQGDGSSGSRLGDRGVEAKLWRSGCAVWAEASSEPARPG